MNFGLPSIFSDNIGTAKDLIKDGISGFILNNTSKYKVLNYINRILSDENFVSRSKIFNKNKLALYSPEQNASVISNYSKAKIVYINLIRTLINLFKIMIEDEQNTIN